MRLARLIPLLMLAVAFLGWETYLAWLEPPVSILPASARAPAVSAGDNASEQAAATELAAAVAQVTARPLLRPDRQPFKEVVFVTVVPQRNYEAEMIGFTVLGILPIDGKETALVIRKGTNSGSERWELVVGDPLPGFVVKAIRQDGVLLTADGKDFLLPLYGGGPKQVAGSLRTEAAATHSVAGGMPPQGVGGPPAVPQGVLPGAIPMRAPDPGMNRVRNRRPSVMPSRSQFTVP